MTTNTEDNSLDARPTKMHQLLNESLATFTVPDYQREYEWGKQQLTDLWDDIRSAAVTESSHFLGQIILVPRTDSTYEIVDGQQRLISISVLICALRDRFVKIEGNKWGEKLDEYLTTSDRKTGVDKRRLKFSNHEDDREQYQHVYSGEDRSLSGEIISAYRFFSRKISELDDAEANEIRETVLYDLNVIRTEPGDLTSAYQVFQTENGRGKELQSVDLMKSILFEKVAKENVDAEAVKDDWLGMIDDLRRVRTSSRAKPTRQIYQSLMLSGLLEVNETSSCKIRDFETALNDFTNDDQTVHDFVDHLRSECSYQLSAYHHSYTSDKEFHINYPRPSRTVGQLSRHCIQKVPHVGVVLHALYREASNEQELVDCLELLQILSVRQVLSDKQGAIKRKPFYIVADEITGGKDASESLLSAIKTETPSDSTLKKMVSSREFKDGKFTKVILLELERAFFSNNHSRLTIDDFQVEHIAPRKSFSKDKYTEWRSEFGHSEERFENHNERIGNLTLMDSKQNQRAGADPFDDKKRAYRTSEYKMTRKLQTYDSWGYSEIERRSDDLADLIVERWSING